ncbi:L,D-transpeptidase family protein [Erythrobacter sp. SD-21]|uniref:L,D-transpeptidase family protein n=1 Tax=Erythrobacter sp. SD-21 TaxID=161528 RepID=UPI0012EA1064|nr:L,D-transpeptidase family protein [Erythrobacter sp. SD-21]
MRNALALVSVVLGMVGSFAVVSYAADTRESERMLDQATRLEVTEPDSSARMDLSKQSLSKAVAAKLLPANARSLLRVRTKLRHGEYIWNDEGVPAGNISVFVDIRRQMISVFRGGHEIGTAVVVYGGEGHESPIGKFPIRSKYRDYHSRTYDAAMPHSMFLTNDGVAIHGNVMAAYRATKGCIGLPPEFAKLLFSVAHKGDIVEIAHSVEPGA